MQHRCELFLQYSDTEVDRLVLSKSDLDTGTKVSLQKVGSQIQRIPEISTKKVLCGFLFSDEFSVLVVVRIFQYV